MIMLENHHVTRQNGSALYVGMVVVVCIPYYNGKPALAFYRVNAGRIKPSKRKCALYRRQWYPFFHTKMHQRVENVHDLFLISYFSSNSSSNSFSSPDAVAYKCWGVWKWFNHWIVCHSAVCYLLYLRGQPNAVCIWRFSSFFVHCLSVRVAFSLKYIVV